MAVNKYSILSDPPVATAPFTIAVDEDRCIGCGLCVRQCPCQTIMLVERPYSEQQESACRHACPAGVDIRGYVQCLSGGGSLEEAWRIVTQTNPFPAVTGRVCPHFCEEGCNRVYHDGALNLGGLERAVGDYGIEQGLAFEAPQKRLRYKVAVVGAGPSGMSCAYQLARRGYKVSVYEASPMAGGMLRWAIPDYRLPEAVVVSEIQRILDLGVKLKTGVTLGDEVTLASLRQDFDAVYLAIGAGESRPLGIGHEDAINVMGGLEFLRGVALGEHPPLGERVVVFGGGNTALDAARVARRLGSEVTIAYRRSASEMPALAAEVRMAREEGVALEFLVAPAAFELDGKATVASVVCQRMQLGEVDATGRPRPVPVAGSDFRIEADTFIVATGQAVGGAGLEELLDGGTIPRDAGFQTSLEGVFAGGDAAGSAGTVSAAIGEGAHVARAIDAFLRKEAFANPERREISYADVPMQGREVLPRAETASLAVDERIRDLQAEVHLPLKPDQVRFEAQRCFDCGRHKPEFTSVIRYFGKICIACHNCEAICPQQALKFPHYYKVDQGRWTTYTGIPDPGAGYPNPFREEVPPDAASLAERVTPVEHLIYRRRSNRVYKPDQVPEELVHRILEAGRFAPSAGNSQPWEFLVVRDRDLLTEISTECTKLLTYFTKLYQGRDPLRQAVKKSMVFLKPDSIDQRPMVAIQALLTPKFGQDQLDIFFGAPTVIFVLLNQMGISKPLFSTGMCCQNMVLTAHALGLGTCYTGFAAEPVNINSRLKKILGLEWPCDTVATAITVGYPAVTVDHPVEREFPRVRWIR